MVASPGHTVSHWSLTPVPALRNTMLCCYQWPPLSPSPPSDPLPIKSQIPRRHSVQGTFSLTMASWSHCQSHGRWR